MTMDGVHGPRRRGVPWGGLPVATFVLAAAALAAAAWPGAAELLELDRARVAAEPWRLVTGHLVHFSAAHLGWDLVVLLALGWVCERRWPLRTTLVLLLAIPIVPVLFLGLVPELETYRGLSGLDSTLFVLLAVGLWREGASKAARALPAAVGLGFLAKVGFEAVTGQALFVDAAGLFEPVPLAHLVGGVLGLLVGALPSGRAGQARALVTGQP